MTIAERALEMIQDGFVVGLGTGRAATEFVNALGKRVQQGLRIRGVPTSQRSADLATQLGIPLITLDQVEQLDLDVDGADEVDPNLDLIKGLGGALIREKIVAAAAKRFIVLVGSEKIVPALGAHGVLPVEVVPFALPLCMRRLTAMGMPPTPRQKDGKLFISDNANYVLDCKIQPIADPRKLEAEILAIPGVVGTGLFLGMAHTVLIQDGDNVQVKERKGQ
ncbi:MAG: ribose-5-phosphate isomerase RpiA [Gemmataceae bacterium]|nr:ribose-5-phosphate isomerase RpiA [Gemmataceae bacterium]